MRDWDYAQLSKMAKENGGPEKLVEMFINSGRKDMIPWIGIALAGGVTATLTIQKAIKFFKEKRKQSQFKLDQARQEFIQEIEKYNESQLALNEETEEESETQ